MTGTEKKTEKSKLTDDVEAKINDITMEGGKVIKMEVDYSETVAKKIPEAKEVAKKNLNEALEMLMALEKQTRTGADMHSTAKVLVRIFITLYVISQTVVQTILHFYFIHRCALFNCVLKLKIGTC